MAGRGVAGLASRYLAGYGPASAGDFAAWSGLTAGEAKRAFGTAGEAGWPVEVRARGRRLYVTEGEDASRDAGSRNPSARLLPAFDTYLLGYRDRELVVPGAYRGEVYHGGQTVPTVLLDEEVAGTWRHERRGKKLVIEVAPFGRLSREAAGMIEEEAEDIGRFLGYPVSLEVK